MLRQRWIWMGVGSLGLVLLGGACSPGPNVEARGKIAQLEGKVVRVPDESPLCETHYCEPNYVYTAHFGKKKPKDPPAPLPSATPRPSATPKPSSSPKPSAERADYSRSILKLLEAWRISEGKPEVVVAILDTGAQLDHPDLRANLWVNERERAGQPGVDDDLNGYVDDVHGWDFVNERPRPEDDNEHGTHVAGIIAAARNGVGIVGVAPRTRFMPLKFLDSEGSGDTASAIRAIDYAVASGARIISNSWGGYGRSELLGAAIQRAQDRGVIVVAAAGNNARDIDQTAFFPASFAGVISVASTDSNDERSGFSNFGSSTVLIAAPGSDILSAVPGSRWKELSGTSMAAPQVSGALALALAIQPELSPASAREALCRSARGILLSRVACGRMDVLSLLQFVE